MTDWYVVVTRIPSTGIQHAYGPVTEAEGKRMKRWFHAQCKERGEDPKDLLVSIHKMINPEWSLNG
jgi:hypothetical protein